MNWKPLNYKEEIQKFKEIVVGKKLELRRITRDEAIFITAPIREVEQSIIIDESGMRCKIRTGLEVNKDGEYWVIIPNEEEGVDEADDDWDW